MPFYYDDYNVREPAYSARHGQFMLRRIHELIGFTLDAGKHVPEAVQSPFLGVITDLSPFISGDGKD